MEGQGDGSRHRRELLTSPPREITLDSPCPVCGQGKLSIVTAALDLPYLGDAVQTTVTCTQCNFRHADIILTRVGEPTRWELPIRGVENLSTRVVRSTSGTLRIPELGVLVEPGPASEALITNVEGILTRIVSVVELLSRSAETEEQRARAQGLLATLDEVLEGGREVTLVIDDPFGNSLLLGPGALRRSLEPEEVRRLRTGTYVMDLDGA